MPLTPNATMIVFALVASGPAVSAEPLIVASPLDQGRVVVAEPDVAEPADDDGVRVPSDDLVPVP